ncbi:MAG: glycoside hydrolase family 3 C-terminal domain-containing protein [Clostridiales bacterium]|nr:glycoside hydrolase family 3 C-terminal domain-containing protein [Clostridiales bacterium]
MKPVLYASRSSKRLEREIKHCELARRICAEGIVLLENNGVLPLKSSKIALYGAGARHTAFGGTGSGENNPRYNITPEEGLRYAGLEITTGKWLDEYDRIFDTEFFRYRTALAKAMRKVPLMEHMDYACANPFYLPAGRVLNDEDTIECDTALFILTRQSGEGADRKDIKGDYYITDDEKALLNSVTSKYKDTVLVLNVGSVIDLSFLDEIKFSAVVLLMQGGMETGNALADILTGKVNPSGRLADTWGNAYSDYPSYDTFSERNPDEYQEDYKEGIFAGYRWFDKKNIKPRYAFGYGLSYTTFRIRYLNTEVTGTTISVTASVTNTGTVSGREVLMLYITCPEKKLIREVRSLAAFAKTSLLAPNTTENVTLSFDLIDFAGYDNDTSDFILEEGGYYLTLNGEPVSIIGLDKDAVTEKVAPLFRSERKIEFIKFDKNPSSKTDLPRYQIKASDIVTVTHDYEVPAFETSEKIDEIVSRLSVKEMCRLIVGRTYLGPYRHRVFGAVGYTTSKLFYKGIDGMAMADGPQGLNLTRISTKPLHNLFAIPTLPSALRWIHKVSRIGTSDEKTKKILYYQFCTSWPNETLVAQTWDVELARMQGDAIGKEMLEYGVVFWLAPALNIHRNPLCGRNYEYYSEDPVLTGKMAAYVSKGVEAHKGCFVTLKHFAANNLETKRNRSSSNVDERTLREIYLKAFRIAVKESDPGSVMCSYNKINGVYTALDYNLQTAVLRNEWGFTGLVMTDWFATGHDESLDELCCKAGTDLIMPGRPFISSKIMKAYKKGLISRDDIERSARRIIKAALESHTHKTYLHSLSVTADRLPHLS